MKLSHEHFDVEVCTLDNGLTIITGKVSSALTSVRIVIRGGRAADRIPGSAHLLEHVLCAGPGRRSVHPAYSPLEEYGYRSDADTSLFSTGFEVEGFAENMPLLVQQQMKLVFATSLDSTTVEGEREVVAQEAREDVRRLRFLEKIIQSMFPNDPWLWPNYSAQVDLISRILIADLESLYARQFVSQNCAIIVTGPAAHEEMRSAVEKHVGIIRSDGSKSALPPYPPVQSFVLEMEEEGLQPEVEYRMTLPSQYEWRTHLLNSLLARALDDISHGVLMRSLRLDRKIVYGVAANLGSFPGDPSIAHSYLKLSIPTESEHFALVDDALHSGLRELAEKKFPRSSFDALKLAIRLSIARGQLIPSATRLSRDIADAWVENCLTQQFVESSLRVLSGICYEDFLAHCEQVCRHVPYGKITYVPR